VKRFNAKAATPRSLWCLLNWRNKAIHVVPLTKLLLGTLDNNIMIIEINNVGLFLVK